MTRVAGVTAHFLESVLELPQLSAGEVVALIEGGSDREKSDEEKFSDNFDFCICCK